ncbi:MAG TPA: sialidase family protein [Actinomycetota bacterium]|nr:sialidase family protein [Actinomycetota bacterium]
MRVGVVAVVGVLSLVSSAHAAVTQTTIMTDPFTNTSSQHRTAVEPDSFSWGNTIVAASQVGRFTNGGGSGTGWATSTDGGTTWTQGVLPGITTHNGNGGTFDRVSDPVVAYSARHNVWLINTIPITSSVTVPRVFVSRSTNGGLTWGNPVTVATSATANLDKNWIVCDNTATSPFYGRCYVTWDDHADGNRLYNSVSTDGGLTWSTPRRTANNATGLGAQPVVQPNGTVVVPVANANATALLSYRSTDGGATWSSTQTITSIPSHDPASNLRSIPLPSAEIDAAGRVYVVWQDCRFRTSCRVNDIVMTTSTNGTTWTTVQRIPIDSTTSGVDHFIPGIGVDRTTSGSTARLGLTYYFYRNGACGTSCSLEVGYIQSNNGGSTWSNHVDVAGPFPVSWTANTTQGRMVGDYISTSWVNGRAYGVFSVALAAPSNSQTFNQPIRVPTGGLSGAVSGFVNTSEGEQPVNGAASDHASPRSAIRMH